MRRRDFLRTMTGAAVVLSGRTAWAAPGRFQTRGVVLIPFDLSLSDWPEQAAQAGLNTIGLHAARRLDASGEKTAVEQQRVPGRSGGVRAARDPPCHQLRVLSRQRLREAARRTLGCRRGIRTRARGVTRPRPRGTPRIREATIDACRDADTCRLPPTPYLESASVRSMFSMARDAGSPLIVRTPG